MVLLLWLGHVVAGIVGADHVVTSRVVLTALDQVPLDPLHGDLVGGVVWAGNSFLPLTKRHSDCMGYQSETHCIHSRGNNYFCVTSEDKNMLDTIMKM